MERETKLVSVNVGLQRIVMNNGDPVSTGIFKEPVTLKAGDVLFIPAGKIHAPKNVGSGDGSKLATYVIEKGKPLVVLVK
jgi:mannose-6-phosphate isomerase-like protein (cupin superfamily)